MTGGDQGIEDELHMNGEDQTTGRDQAEVVEVARDFNILTPSTEALLVIKDEDSNSTLSFIYLLLYFFLNFAAATIPIHVVVVHDLNSLVGKVASRCISIVLSNFYETRKNYTTRLILHGRNSEGDVVKAALQVFTRSSNLHLFGFNS
ncbi:hypothetical protein GIB67_000886 [Kingdonia uniflora]|uniref:Uncharacterized protein n=1 Tax=Kingdonia uniflora TaxID=39325 RepID=A0A7J7LIY0_9MAGN|nr:hypothetical protein GIB67_000886 [Kingdonia uniflora]